MSTDIKVISVGTTLIQISIKAYKETTFVALFLANLYFYLGNQIFITFRCAIAIDVTENIDKLFSDIIILLYIR